MRMGITLSRHIAARFARTALGMFLLSLFIIIVADYVELLRSSAGQENFNPAVAFLVTLMRTPSVAEVVLPFAILFGSIATLAVVNRRLEFTIARAAGVSVWQFLLPAALVGAVIGILTITVYDPVSAALKQQSVDLAATIMPSGSAPSGAFGQGPVWLRQKSNEGESILGAAQTAGDGLELTGASAFVFGPDGRFRERVDAQAAHLERNAWVFENATVTALGKPAEKLPAYRLPTNLSLEEIRESFADPETVPFWRLPELVRIAQESSLPANHLRQRLHSLLSLPVLLVAMILIAGAVSLRFSRTLGLGRMIAAGAGAGFVLYVVMEITKDLGRGGNVSPAIAAWLPAVLAMMASVTFLLNAEDG